VESREVTRAAASVATMEKLLDHPGGAVDQCDGDVAAWVRGGGFVGGEDGGA